MAILSPKKDTDLSIEEILSDLLPEQTVEEQEREDRTKLFGEKPLFAEKLGIRTPAEKPSIVKQLIGNLSPQQPEQKVDPRNEIALQNPELFDEYNKAIKEGLTHDAALNLARHKADPKKDFEDFAENFYQRGLEEFSSKLGSDGKIGIKDVPRLLYNTLFKAGQPGFIRGELDPRVEQRLGEVPGEIAEAVVPTKEDESGLRGFARGGIEFAASLASPHNMALMVMTGGLGGTMGRAVSATFSGEMGSHAIETAPEVARLGVEAIETGNWSAFAEKLAGLIGTSVFTYKTGKHAAKGLFEKSIQESIEKAPQQEKQAVLEALDDIAKGKIEQGMIKLSRAERFTKSETFQESAERHGRVFSKYGEDVTEKVKAIKNEFDQIDFQRKSPVGAERLKKELSELEEKQRKKAIAKEFETSKEEVEKIRKEKIESERVTTKEGKDVTDRVDAIKNELDNVEFLKQNPIGAELLKKELKELEKTSKRVVSKEGEDVTDRAEAIRAELDQIDFQRKSPIGAELLRKELSELEKSQKEIKKPSLEKKVVSPGESVIEPEKKVDISPEKIEEKPEQIKKYYNPPENTAENLFKETERLFGQEISPYFHPDKISLQILRDEMDYYPEIDVIYVPSELREKGTGTKLMKSFEQAAKNQGEGNIGLYAFPHSGEEGNTYSEVLDLINWYKKLGYKLTSENMYTLKEIYKKKAIEFNKNENRDDYEYDNIKIGFNDAKKAVYMEKLLQTANKGQIEKTDKAGKIIKPKKLVIGSRRIGTGKNIIWEDITKDNLQISDYLNNYVLKKEKNPFPNKMYRFASNEEFDKINQGEKSGRFWNYRLSDDGFKTKEKLMFVAKDKTNKGQLENVTGLLKNDIESAYQWNNKFKQWEEIKLKEKSKDAEAIRGDKAEILEQGVQPEVSEEKRGKDIQREKPEQPSVPMVRKEVKEVEKPEVTPKVIEPEKEITIPKKELKKLGKTPFDDEISYLESKLKSLTAESEHERAMREHFPRGGGFGRKAGREDFQSKLNKLEKAKRVREKLRSLKYKREQFIFRNSEEFKIMGEKEKQIKQKEKEIKKLQNKLPIVNFETENTKKITAEEWNKTHRDFKGIELSEDGTHRYRVIMSKRIFISDKPIKNLSDISKKIKPEKKKLRKPSAKEPVVEKTIFPKAKVESVEVQRVTYFDKNEAERTGLFVREIKKGKAKGSLIIKTVQGNKITIPEGRIKNYDELVGKEQTKKKPQASFGSLEKEIIAEPAELSPLKTESQKKREQAKKDLKESQKKLKEGSALDVKNRVKELMRNRRAFIDLKSFDTNKFVHDLNLRTKRRDRELISFLLEKTGIPKKLGRKDLEKLHKAEMKNPRLTEEVRKIKKHFDEGWKFMQEHMDDISADQIEYYVTHIWDISNKRKSEVSNWFITRNRFLRQRYIDTLYKGIEELGLKPKVLDVGEIIKIHDAVMNKVIANKRFVRNLKILKKDGIPLIARADLAPVDWISVDHPSLSEYLFKPGEKKRGEVVSDELNTVLHEMGVAIGRRINPKAWGKLTRKLGEYRPGEPPEIRLQRFFSNKTVTHEIGHYLDEKLGLGHNFQKKYRNELFALNRKRIEEMSAIGKRRYAESSSEQVAELFAHMFTKPKETAEVAPNAMQDVLNRLRQDETLTKLIDFDFEKKAKIILDEQSNLLLKLPVRVHPDIAKPLKVIFDSRINTPIINAYEAVNAFLKKTILSLSLFHHMALGETGVATSGLRKTANLYANPVKIYKEIFKGKLDAYKNVEATKDAIKHNVQLGASADIPVQKIQEALRTLERRTENILVAKQLTRLISSFNEKWDMALWDYLHDSLKLKGYETLVSKLDPLKVKDMTKAKREIAQVVNDTFGGQNWDLLMTNPKSLQIASWFFLSPDWTLSTLRQAMAPLGVGKIYNETAHIRKKAGTMFWLKAAGYYGIGINALNALYRTRDMQQNSQFYEDDEKKEWYRDYWNRTMFGNTIGHRTHLFAGRYDDGSERYIRWGKQFREFPEFIFDNGEFNPITAGLKKIGGKVAPVPQIVTSVMSGGSLSGFENRDIRGKKGYDRMIGIFKTIAKAPLPFSSRTMLPGSKKFHLSDLAMPSSKGMSRYKAVELFKMGINGRDEQFIKEVYDDALKNNLDAHGLFGTALSSVKSTNTKEIKSSVKTIEDAENKKKNASSNEIKVLDRYIKAQKKQILNIKQGNLLLDKSLNKYNSYLEDIGEVAPKVVPGEKEILSEDVL